MRSQASRRRHGEPRDSRVSAFFEQTFRLVPLPRPIGRQERAVLLRNRFEPLSLLTEQSEQGVDAGRPRAAPDSDDVRWAEATVAITTAARPSAARLAANRFLVN